MFRGEEDWRQESQNECQADPVVGLFDGFFLNAREPGGVTRGEHPPQKTAQDKNANVRRWWVLDQRGPYFISDESVDCLGPLELFWTPEYAFP